MGRFGWTTVVEILSPAATTLLIYPYGFKNLTNKDGQTLYSKMIGKRSTLLALTAKALQTIMIMNTCAKAKQLLPSHTRLYLITTNKYAAYLQAIHLVLN